MGPGVPMIGAFGLYMGGGCMRSTGRRNWIYLSQLRRLAFYAAIFTFGILIGRFISFVF